MIFAQKPVRVLFASASRGLAEQTLERFRKHHQELSLIVVSEFPPAHGQWIRYHLKRSFRQNLALCRWRLRGKRIDISAIVLEPRSPFKRLRLLSFLIPAALRIAYNENGDFFPISWTKRKLIYNHASWRLKNWFAFRRHNRTRVAVTPLSADEPQIRRFRGATSKRPLVLIASPYIPFPLSHGGAVRMFNLMQRAFREFDQVLVCFVDTIPSLVPPELMELCVEVVLVERRGSHLHPSRSRPETVEEFDWPVFHRALRETVDRWQPAVAQLEFTQMAQYAGDCRPARTILVEHDITFDLYRQMQTHQPDWETAFQLRLWERFEKRAWKKVNRVVVMSERDRSITGKQKSVALPNGVDVNRFTPSDDHEVEGRILFIGSFNHLPNLIGLEWFLNNVWPLIRHPQRTLHVIAGARHEYYRGLHRTAVPLELPGVELEGFVSDVRSAYQAAAVVIVPLQVGAGTCIKVLEAMAMGKPVVSTAVGLAGLDVVTGREVVEASTAPLMAQEVDALLFDGPKRRWVGDAARKRVVSEYSWDAIAAKQAELYRALMDSKPPPE